MGRAAVPCVYADDVELELGRAYVLREGERCHHRRLRRGDPRGAGRRRRAWPPQGVSAEVIDAFSVKPLDAATILASAREDRSRRRRPRSTASSAAWARRSATLLAGAIRPRARECVGRAATVFGKSGEFEELLGYFHLDATAIVEAVKNVVTR